MRRLLWVVALASGAVANAQAQAVLRYETTEAHLTVRALAFSPAGRPFALISRAPDRFAVGPHQLSVLGAAGGGRPSLTVLRNLERMGPYAALAVDPAGEYALAASDERGLLLSRHAADGRQIAGLEEPLPDHVPVALIAVTGGHLLVSNRGYHLVDRHLDAIAQEKVDAGWYVAAAASLPDAACGLVSLEVEAKSRRWRLQRICVESETLERASSIEGPAEARSAPPFRLSAREQTAWVSSARSDSAGWIVGRCTFAQVPQCSPPQVSDAPANPVSLVKGLHVLPLASAEPVIVAPTADGRGLWVSRLRFPTQAETASRVIALPGVVGESSALIESLVAQEQGGEAWIAVAYGDWDAHPRAKPGAPRQRSTVIVDRIDGSQIP